MCIRDSARDRGGRERSGRPGHDRFVVWCMVAYRVITVVIMVLTAWTAALRRARAGGAGTPSGGGQAGAAGGGASGRAVDGQRPRRTKHAATSLEGLAIP